MRKLIVVPILLLLTGCPQPTDQTARDAIAAAHGWIVNAQATWGDSCRANTAQVKCTSTNKLIAAEHVAADALAAYCGGPATPSYANGGPCVPITGYKQSLIAAITNMNNIATDVKNLLGAK